MAEERIEQQFRKDAWLLANNFSEIEQAVAEGRDLAYTALRSAEPGSLLESEAQRWLEMFGRDDARQRLLGYKEEGV